MSKTIPIKDGEVYEYPIEDNCVFIFTQHYDDKNEDCVFINVPKGKKVEMVKKETIMGRMVYQVTISE